MKRDQRALFDGRTASEVDGRARRRMEAEEGDRARLARALDASRARLQKLEHWLDKWSTLNAVIATELKITAPVPNPLGPTVGHALVRSRPLSLILMPPRFLSLL